ncbi:hypothetical protein OV079_17410 [Nannocystis pusilla]|uniref:Uncharacterized protein n=1 Tax=Nannocystis pusilla TaxID=889268 RepID=A0A9X3EQ25_9BACT|nr:hypothetical protein [Nannocystis pusilla]MCY1007299.1 hypothetical protein [Nannocystis pusilla]
MSAGAGPKPAEPAPTPPAQEAPAPAEPTPAPKPFEPLGAGGLSNSRSQGKSGLFDIPGPGGLGGLLPGAKPNPRDKKP